MHDEIRELRDFQLTPSEENKLITIYERFKRYKKRLSMQKIAFKLSKIEKMVKKHDKELRHILAALKR